MRWTTWCGPLAVVMIVSSALGADVPIHIYENADNANLDDLDVWVAVTDNSGGVDFTFRNESGDESQITQIYFESTDFSAGSSALIDASTWAITFESAGVDLEPPATPENPQGGIDPAWNGNSYAIGRDPPPGNVGIHAGEYMTVNVQYDNGGTLADVLAALSSGEWRIAMHIQSVGDDGDSIWGVTEQSNIVPLPSASAMALAGVGFIGLRRRR